MTNFFEKFFLLLIFLPESNIVPIAGNPGNGAAKPAGETRKDVRSSGSVGQRERLIVACVACGDLSPLLPLSECDRWDFADFWVNAIFRAGKQAAAPPLELVEFFDNAIFLFIFQ